MAEEKRFESLRELIRSVADMPLTELSEEVRGVLREQGSDQRLLLATFFAACDARARDAATKRAHSVPDEVTPRKIVQCFSSFLFFFFFVSTDLQPLNRGLLLSPLEVLLPTIGSNEPQFCVEDGWLDSVTHMSAME